MVFYNETGGKNNDSDFRFGDKLLIDIKHTTIVAQAINLSHELNSPTSHHFYHYFYFTYKFNTSI